ncbi:hypothetical protein EKK58_10130 [Candidatus Dependentiae bacterium]|nr:MAG: hypothetical protein EKK58_10130 [Candidatus Dependentiae bacterium]
MILNGKNSPLGSGAEFVPDVSNGVMFQMQNVEVTVMQKVNLDGYTSEIPIKTKTMATKEAFTQRQLLIKPEGQRRWQWFRLRMLNNVILALDDRFILDSKPYRVMATSNYKEYGYNEYDVVLDYEYAK